MVRKQTIQLEFKNTPTDTPQVCSSVSLPLTSDQSRSVADIVTELYHADEDQQEEQPEQNCKVSVANVHIFVLDANGTPLMPCSPRKARKLLKDGKAIVKKARPFFVIKLVNHVGDITR